MVHSFHEMADLARKAFASAWEQKPAHRDDLMLIRAHYELSFNIYTHAMIHFITNDNVDDAITKFMRERGMKRLQAKSAMTAAIEKGPKVWLRDFDFLYSKGVAAIGGHCFVLPPDLRTNTPYYTAFQQLSSEAQKIALAALGLALKHGNAEHNFSFGPLTQQYLVAQLMREGAEKDFRFTALSMDKDSMVQQKQMANSAFAVRHFAKEVGIETEVLNIVLREGRVPETRPVDKKPAATPRMASFGKDKNSTLPAPANDMDDALVRSELRQSLRKVIGKNGITNVHAQLYFFLSNMSEGPVPTHEDAALKFKVPEKAIPGIINNIERALDTLNATPSQDLVITR